MKILRYKTVSSTNTLAHDYAKCEGAELPAVFIADGQTAGRGRRGRSFVSDEGAGLYVSFVFKPEKSVTPADITVRAAVAAVRAMKTAFGFSADVKWVNDIFWGGKKLGGILAEGECDEEGNLAFAVVGIGVNLRKRAFSSELADIATTVEDVTGTAPDNELFERELIKEFFAVLQEESVIEEYKKSSVALGRRIEVKRISGERFFATALDVTEQGELVVLREDGQTETLFSAEISIRLWQTNAYIH